jgi:3-hydroxyisobutyrate dehydrogenase
MNSQPRIAFLGLGIMGIAMARRLLDAGFPLTIFNRSADKARPLAAAGARVASTAREAAEDVDIVIAMVADDAASRQLWLGDNGALAGAAKGALLIECSTLSTGWVSELNTAAKAAGCELLDAPVAGSKPQAIAGELRFFVGGSAEALEKARPELSVMGQSITHVGSSGSGALLKLINNFMCGVQIVTLAEAMALIESSGLDRTRALEVLTTGAPGSPLVKTMSGRMTARDYTPNFQLQLAAKDLRYAMAEAAKHGLTLTTAATAYEMMNRGIQAGRGAQDFSSVIEEFRKG